MDCTSDTQSTLQWPLIYLFPQTHLQCKALSQPVVQHSDLEATKASLKCVSKLSPAQQL